MPYLIRHVVLWVLVHSAAGLTWPHEGGFHDYQSTARFMRSLEKAFPHLIRMYPIGKSENGLTLEVIELSGAPGNFSKRNVCIIGSIYGNEAVGRELVLNFAHFLATTYVMANSSSPQLMDLLHVHILPSLNPDGGEVSQQGVCRKGMGKKNMHGVDINSNFPVFNASSTTPDEPVASETKAVMFWMEKLLPVLSVTFRGLAYVVAYPYETRASKNDGSPRLAPDDDVLKHLAGVYAHNNPKLRSMTACGEKSYPQGITNGAAWRDGTGGIQDYMYSRMGSMHLNIAVTCCQHPMAHDLHVIWDENRHALIKLLVEACGGVSGIVRDALSKRPVEKAHISVLPRSEIPLYSAKIRGSFSRILLPGLYEMEIFKKGYIKAFETFRVNATQAVYVNEDKFIVHRAYVDVMLMPKRMTPLITKTPVKDQRSVGKVTPGATDPVTVPPAASTTPKAPSHQTHLVQNSHQFTTNAHSRLTFGCGLINLLTLVLIRITQQMFQLPAVVFSKTLTS